MFLTANVKTDADQKPELLQITVLDAADRRAYERELRQARERAEKEQGRVRVFAETLRRALLPPLLSPPAGLDAADYYYAASVDDVGGDFYDLFPVSRTTWGFFLGDVAGKGVEAAVVTGLTRYTLRAAAYRRRSGAGAAQPQHRARPKTQRRAHSVLHTDLREADPVQQRV
jgi:sigma-B regulation protein RsbU (phosphoserine phosphatase)